MSINNITISGRVARIDELTVSDTGGDALFRLNFSVACNRLSKERKADFFNCTAFGRNAENFANIMNKGEQIVISGRLQIDEWEKNGEKRTAPKIIVNGFDKMWPPKQQEEPAPANNGLQESNFNFNG